MQGIIGNPDPIVVPPAQIPVPLHIVPNPSPIINNPPVTVGAVINATTSAGTSTTSSTGNTTHQNEHSSSTPERSVKDLSTTSKTLLPQNNVDNEQMNFEDTEGSDTSNDGGSSSTVNSYQSLGPSMGNAGSPAARDFISKTLGSSSWWVWLIIVLVILFLAGLLFIRRKPKDTL